MLNANEIKSVRFSAAVGGYKKDEVDVFLDKVEADYEQFEKTLREMNNKISELKTELEDYKNSQGNIQNVLVSAQKFADQIVEEAKQKSAEIIASAQDSIEKITAQEKELTTAFDKKASERKDALQSDVDKIISNAEQKQTAIEAATQDCVDRQQLLFNKMKIEVAAFKAEITAKYKEHLELLASLPDSVPNDPSEIAAAVSLSYDKVPTVKEYAKNPVELALSTDEVIMETPSEEPAEKLIETVTGSSGFVINSDEFDFDDDEQDVEELEDI
ncbi:MAG: DivIVA domain-containing protein [Clostridia bacterium]|nr:DivIVA domain-containing protein [Clostridia bacterium]